MGTVIDENNGLRSIVNGFQNKNQSHNLKRRHKPYPSILIGTGIQIQYKTMDSVGWFCAERQTSVVEKWKQVIFISQEYIKIIGKTFSISSTELKIFPLNFPILNVAFSLLSCLQFSALKWSRHIQMHIDMSLVFLVCFGIFVNNLWLLSVCYVVAYYWRRVSVLVF